MLQLYSIEETAPILKISTVTLRRLIKKGKISFRLIAKKYFFSNDDITQFLDSVHHLAVSEVVNENP